MRKTISRRRQSEAIPTTRGFEATRIRGNMLVLLMAPSVLAATRMCYEKAETIREGRKYL
jgi:hypothetical protein